MTEYTEQSRYQLVAAALRVMNCDIGAAECHGILCGMLCGVREFEGSAWLDHTTGYHGDINLPDLGADHPLSQLVTATLAELSADDFSLRILLPEDDCPLAARTEALGSWCRGFLSGFGLTDQGEAGHLSEDAEEFLHDLQDIGRIDPKESGDGADEFAFVEVCEYTRMGALLLLDETEFVTQNNRRDETVH